MKTIIESLKYATTGEMPTGTGKGQNFIHDPHLTTKKMVLSFTTSLVTILRHLVFDYSSPLDR